MKFGQLKEYNLINIFRLKSCSSETERIVPDLFLFFKTALDEIKTSDLQFSFSIDFKLAYNN